MRTRPAALYAVALVVLVVAYLAAIVVIGYLLWHYEIWFAALENLLVARAGPGGVFGEVALVDPSPRLASVIAEVRR